MPETKIILNKLIGETPLESINRFKNLNPEYRYLPMTYAGRLDPLAEGVLLLLAGDECLKKDEYLALTKEYELTILFGFSTDTHDLLGKVVDVTQNPPIEEIESVLNKFCGKFEQTYPSYSSRPVMGKPLWEWSRSGRLGEIEIPKHEVMIHDIQFVEKKEISGRELFANIEKAVSLVSGDFRQEEINSLWREALSTKQQEKFTLIKIVANVGSGAYMRVLAKDIGYRLGGPALAYHIKRTKIGDYSI